VESLSGCTGIMLEFDQPAVSDNCGLESYTQTAGMAPGSIMAIGLDTLVFTAVDSSGNSTPCSIAVEVQGFPELILTAVPQLGCLNDTVIITATPLPGATYTWTGPQGQFPTTNQILIPSFAEANEGVYSASATINGCQIPAGSVTVNLASAPDAVDDTGFFIDPGTTDTFNILDNDVLVPFSDYSITEVGDLNGLTNLGNGTFSFEAPEEGGVYSFLYEVCSKSCPDLCDMALVTIRVVSNESCSFIPNIITPNGDVANDWLEIPCLNSGLYRDNSIVIFNQWGDKVYEMNGYDNNDPAKRWEGTLNGEPGKDLPDGVYFYIFRPDANEPVIKGFVEIFR
jgi:gliding motility-associated-like protein